MAELVADPSVSPPVSVEQQPRVRLVFAALLLVLLLASLDQTIVATALPTIVGELGGLEHLSWVVTAYLLASTIAGPLYGKLGDLYGRKRILQTAIVIFLIGSALCGLAQDMTQLIAFRALQGLGGGGLIVTAGPLSVLHRELIIRLAAQHKLPAIYIERFFAAAGGLVSYGPNFVDQTRQAGTYVARIFKGEKPANLPVQAPTKYELVINSKAAKALGLELSPTLLARADEVIE